MPLKADCLFHQGGALVHVYLDGSVLVTHGGIEMGQGLNTKMIQVRSPAIEFLFTNLVFHTSN